MATIQHIRGTTTQWAASTYILAEAEIGIEIDNTDNTIIVGAKVGNGIELWSALDYLGGGLAENGIPPGGDAGQILAKDTATDYDAIWIDNYANWTSQVKHEVKLGEAISKGQAVYVSSADGTNIVVSKASNATEATSSKTLGLLESGGSQNAKVKVITEGLLSGLDTSSATAGDPVWLGTDGNLIFGLNNKPSAASTPPAHLVFIGVVTRVQSETGEIFIQPQNGFEFRELHDVLIESPADNEVMAYDNASSLWKNQTAAEAGLAEASHTHAAADVTSGVLDINRIPSIDISRIPTGTTSSTVAFGNRGVPTGVIQMYVNASAPNSEWIVCDGSAISRTLYPNLFAVIGTTYGAGDGATTFNIPNMQGRVPVGKAASGTFGALNSPGGSETASLTISQIPVHNHSIDHDHGASNTDINSVGHTHNVTNRSVVTSTAGTATVESWPGGSGTNRTIASGGVSANHTHSFDMPAFAGTSGDAGNGAAPTHNNLQPYIVVNYIIKT